MGQFYTVSNSMRAKDIDGNPKVWESQYGTFDIWNVYFEGDNTKYQVNKKPGFEGYERGKKVYGTTTKSQYGGRFKQEQAPDGYEAPSAAQEAPRASQSGGSSTIEQKLDYIIGLLENNAQFQGSRSRPASSNDSGPSDIDDGPVNLDNLDY